MHILSKNTTDKNIKEIIIRADVSNSIGTGHIMRCLTLAGELNKQGAAVSLICREETGINHIMPRKLTFSYFRC